MIPNEKIEQAAKEYAASIWGEDRSQSLNVYAKSAENDFTAGVRFAEAEMKSIEELKSAYECCKVIAQFLSSVIVDPDTIDGISDSDVNLHNHAVKYMEWFNNNVTK